MLKKKLDLQNSLIKTKLYPKVLKKKKSSKKEYNVILGIGGNMGDTNRRFEKLFHYFNHSQFIKIKETSPIFKNPPFGYKNQEDFFNTIIKIKTPLLPLKLLDYILKVEKRFKRKRLFKDAPRTLDIDIIFYENRNINTKRLTIPHKEWQKRASVIIPLSYMKGKN